MGLGTLIAEPLQGQQKSMRPRPRVTRSDLVVTAMLRAMPKDSERALQVRLEQETLRAGQEELRAEKAHFKVASLEAEVARLRDKDRQAARLARFTLWRRVVDSVGWAVVIAATAIPLNAVEPLARHFAGANAQLEAGLRISIAFNAVIGVSFAITIAQNRLRKRKIKNLRRRQEELEDELAEKNPEMPKAGT